jgi:hypothetical protein
MSQIAIMGVGAEKSLEKSNNIGMMGLGSESTVKDPSKGDALPVLDQDKIAKERAEAIMQQEEEALKLTKELAKIKAEQEKADAMKAEMAKLAEAKASEKAKATTNSTKSKK